jgi:hypothetical protein
LAAMTVAMTTPNGGIENRIHRSWLITPAADPAVCRRSTSEFPEVLHALGVFLLESERVLKLILSGE